MGKNLSDQILIFDECQDAHGPVAFGTGQGVEGFGALSVSGFIDDLGFPRKIGYPVLGKGCANDVPGQVFHGLGMTGQDAGAGVDMES